ncbi:septum formation initiator family protein [Bifidobacterium sp. ESL0704]|uniref:FtsB family cell division protein n=1 Tax=Bifidobacterium sp. ESL0704 TaxID=2983219 RepID=UPI0023F6C5A3|nr:septum formation initiator family protein [Bifidobacterium sp. ESL0704]WEV52426.1 septum formation initiator family protein [Bifidobacterium sp. ESL0704]
MGITNEKSKVERGKKQSRRRGSGPVAFFVAFFIVVLGAIQLAATFHSYALNLAELNGLKRQEAALVVKKQNLENDISRWNDNAYVTAQARERLGFVFPGEQAIHVEHPEAVTGVKPKSESAEQNDADSDKPTLPWYRELAYGFKKADEPLKKAKTDEVTTPKAVGGKAVTVPNSGNKSKSTDNKTDNKNVTNSQNQKGQKADGGNAHGGKSGAKASGQ